VAAVLLPLGLASALVLAALLLRSRKALFWLVFLLPFVPIEYIDRYHHRLPTVVKWSPLIVTLMAAVVATAGLPGIRVRVPGRVVLAMLAVIGFSLVSMLLNGTSPMAFAVAQRGWIVAVSVMVGLKTAYPEFGRRDLHGFLVRAGLVSSVVSVLQRLFVVPFTPGIDAADRVTGIFSVGYIQLYFHLFCIGLVLSYWLAQERLPGLPPLPTLGLLVFSLAIGNEKASLPYLLCMVLFLVWRAGIRETLSHSWKTLLIMFATPAVLLAGFAAVNDPEQDPLQADQDAQYANQITDKEYLWRYLFGDGETRFTSGGALRRGAAIVFAWQEIAGSPLQIAVGAGPGETAESRLPGASGHMAERYPGYGINRISLSMVLGDIGLIGILMHALFLAAVWFARTPGESGPERWVRELFVFVAVGFSVYANMTNEAIYCLLMAVVLYPRLHAPAVEELS